MATKRNTRSHCKMCGAPSYIDKANGDDYGYCLACIIGTFGQCKDHRLFVAAPAMRNACRAPELDNAHDELSALLEDDDAGNDEIMDAAINICVALNAHYEARQAALKRATGER